MAVCRSSGTTVGRLPGMRSAGPAIEMAATGRPRTSRMGAPILDVRGHPVAAISIAGPAERMPGKRPAVVPLLLQTAKTISNRLGYVS